MKMAVTDTLSPVTRPIYDRKYPALKRFSWPWRILATYTSFLTWLASTPWLAIRSIAPQNLQDNLDDFERNYFKVATPIINFIQDTSYKVFNMADATADWVINTGRHVYHHNLKGFEHTFDHMLRNAEHRMRILKDDGLNGIPKALGFDVRNPIHNHQPAAAHQAAHHQPAAAYPITQKLT